MSWLKRKATQALTAEKAAHFAWLEITGPEKDALVGSGMPTRVPVVPYDRDKKVFQRARSILQNLIDDQEWEAVTVEHDEDLTLFPHIVDALNTATGEAIQYCIARHVKLGRWAVGTGYNIKGRENAAKVALAVSIAQEAGKMEKTALDEGDFATFCVQAGLLTQDQLPEGSKGTGAVQWPLYTISLKPPSAGEAASVLTESKNLPATAPAVYYHKDWHDCFAAAHLMLIDLVGDDAQKVEYTHDFKDNIFDATVFPEVRQAIADARGHDECICVATLQECNVWGVGLAAGQRNREMAAKIALALALSDDPAVFDQCINNYRDFAVLCVAAELLPSDRLPAKQKQAEWGEDDGWGSSKKKKWGGEADWGGQKWSGGGGSAWGGGGWSGGGGKGKGW